jgi:hypothetical protein
LISDFVPVTVILWPLRTAGPSCPPSPGPRSTTLPFWRYKLRTSPPGPALKARTREDWVTVGSCCEVSAVAASGGTAGGAGGVGTGLCANATEPSASPSAVIFREDGMFIGYTSTRHRQAACQLSQPPKSCSNCTFGSVKTSEAPMYDRNSLTCCADCVRIVLSRRGSEHLILEIGAEIRHDTDGSQVAYHNDRVLDRSSEEHDERGAECRRYSGEAFAHASCCSSF